MNRQAIVEILSKTLEDKRLSRSERRAVDLVFGDHIQSDADANLVRSLAFDQARKEVADARDGEVLEWLEDVVKAIAAAVPSAASVRSRAYFSPGEDCLRALQELIGGARSRLDICVYTVTDDRLAEEIVAAHKRGVEVRIVTDDDKAGDEGSDAVDLARRGLAVAVDETDKHMHHKFAVADGKTLVTGSYNWTRSAATRNEENVVVTDDPGLVRAFSEEFEKLWRRLA